MIRPTSLTVVGWFLIVGSALALFFMAATLNWLFGPYPIPITYLLHWPYGFAGKSLRVPYLLPMWPTFAFGVIVSVVKFVAGIAMLKGREWSRKVYIAISVLGFSVALVDLPATIINVSDTAPMFLILEALVFALFVHLLHQPQAAEYFGQANVSSRPVSLTVVAWFLIVSNPLLIVKTLIIVSTVAPPTQSRSFQLMMFAFGIITTVVKFVAGIAILKGREWSRNAYVVVIVLSYALAFVNLSFMPAATSSKTLAIVINGYGLLLAVLFIYLLYRRPATKYFRHDSLSTASEVL